MAEAVKSITASTYSATTGQGIRYIGKWVYGYSGIVEVNNIETDLINTVSGSGFIVAQIQFFYGQSGNTDNYIYKIYLNNIALLAKVTNGTSQAPGEESNRIRIIIPPFTTIRLTARNDSDNPAREQAATFTGRVYGAE